VWFPIIPIFHYSTIPASFYSSTPVLHFSRFLLRVPCVPCERDIPLSFNEEIAFPVECGFQLFQYSIVPTFPPLFTPVLHSSSFMGCSVFPVISVREKSFRGRRGRRPYETPVIGEEAPGSSHTEHTGSTEKKIAKVLFSVIWHLSSVVCFVHPTSHIPYPTSQIADFSDLLSH